MPRPAKSGRGRPGPAPAPQSAAQPQHCALCGRPLGQRIEQHHLVPRSLGGRDTVAVHPICHRMIHRHVSAAELARDHATPEALRAHPALARFIAWIAGKPPDFHARTAGTRRARPRRDAG